MIATPIGWTRRHVGTSVALFPPGGAERGVIRYDERIHGLVPLSQLHPGPWEAFTTDEGEHAAAITVGDQDLAIVFLDEGHARIHGTCLHADDRVLFATTVRELARGDTHFLGERRRRYEHDAPTGWQRRARGMHAEWTPIEAARASTVISVWAALPCRRVSAGRFVDLVLAEDPHAHVCEQRRFTRSMHALDGREVVLESERGRRTVVVLEDDRYIYPMRVEAPAADLDAVAVLEGLARSVRRVPRPRGVTIARIDSLAHWSE